MDQYEEIRANVDKLLADFGVRFTVVNRGVRTVKPEVAKCSCPGETNWPVKAYEQDAWSAEFRSIVGGASTKTKAVVDFDYFTGIGQRWLPDMTNGYARFLKDKDGKPRNPQSFNSAFERRQADVQAKPIAPRAADVLYSLVLDASAMHMSFHDWASDFDYDTDSISALNTYNACCKEGRDLRIVFTSEQVRLLEDAVREL